MADSRVGEPSRRKSEWADHHDGQLRRLAGLSLAEKLAWLEEAQRLVEHLDAQRHRSKT